MKIDINTLRERQYWTLPQKIDHSLATIDAFISRLGGPDKVYCSFSGGKDSTVLLHLCRVLYPDILAVFCSTGNEYPEIVRFVNEQKATGVNIQIIRPKITPRELFRLQDLPDEYTTAIQAAGISKTQQHKLAGNSIPVKLLYLIFRNLFINEERK